MEAYLKAYMNYKQDDQTRLLTITEFVYNNTKNASIGHTSFELNCDYHYHIFYKKDINPQS